MPSASQIQQLQASELRLFELFAGAIHNRCMIDVGAHQGDTLQPFVNMGWRVDAFEPIEGNRHKLKERFSSCQNLTIHSQAVSNTSGYKDFHLALKKDGELHEYYHSLERIGLDNYHRKGESIKIQTIALDDLIRSGLLSSKVGFLKIDTEGHDLAVLEGASLLVADAISVEFWGDQHVLGKSPSPLAEMANLLNTRGYTTFIVLCRQGEAVGWEDSISRVPLDSWGNAIFFREECAALSEECSKILQSSLSLTRPSRLPKILRRVLPHAAFAFIDVGADMGNFSLDVLEDFPYAMALLFEPSELGFRKLETRFRSKCSVRIFNLELGSKAVEADCVAARRQTLDTFLAGQSDLPPIGLLSIDLRERDLRILEGAQGTLAIHRPAILVKTIFVDRHEAQSSYFDILEFMRGHEYRLLAMVAPHATPEGGWVFADLLFVVGEVHRKLMGDSGIPDHCVRTDSEYLLAQNQMLQEACDDRLQLIHRLNAAAEDRLKVIEILDAEVKRLSGKRPR